MRRELRVGSKLIAAWHRLPPLVRAPLVAFIVLFIGSTAGSLPVLANTRLLPAVPWSLAVTSLAMAAFWSYFTGGGYPAATRSVRRQVTRLKSLPGPIWRAAAMPLLLSMLTVTSLRLLLPGIFPLDPPKIALDLGSFSPVTVIGMVLSIALTAGVVEEVAFRGYLQKPLEDYYGVPFALTFTGVAFWLAHAEKVGLGHLPFHLLASILLGLSAYLTRSLLPAILGHLLGDVILLTVYVFHKPDLLWSDLTARPLWEGSGAVTLGERIQAVLRAMAPSEVLGSGRAQGFAVAAWVFLVSAPLACAAFVRLARVARHVWPAPEEAQASHAGCLPPRT